MDKLIIEKENTRKAKRNRHPTTCLAKTKSGHYNNCPFCGSEDLIEHGVNYCTFCDYDEYFFEHYPTWGLGKKCINHDKDIEYHKKLKRNISKHTMRRISVVACSNCGAIRTGVCPNCKFKTRYFYHKPWKNHIGKIACSGCGFRSK